MQHFDRGFRQSEIRYIFLVLFLAFFFGLLNNYPFNSSISGYEEVQLYSPPRHLITALVKTFISQKK